jgi:hypothetical protein
LRLGETDPALTGTDTADPLAEDEARTAQVMRMMNDLPDSDEERELMANRSSGNKGGGDESDEIDYDEYFSSLAQTHKNLKNKPDAQSNTSTAPTKKQMQVVDDDEDDDAVFNSLVSQHLI